MATYTIGTSEPCFGLLQFGVSFPRVSAVIVACAAIGISVMPINVPGEVPYDCRGPQVITIQSVPGIGNMCIEDMKLNSADALPIPKYSDVLAFLEANY